MDGLLGNQTKPLVLPRLREELEIISGAPQTNGAPSWVIFDPISNRYFEIGREFLDLLSVWGVGTADRLKKVAQEEFNRIVEQEEIEELVSFLIKNSLVEEIPDKSYEAFLEQDEARQKSIWSKITHGYLFFRIPLFRPDAFLRWTWPLVSPLFTKTAVVIYVLMALSGLYLVSRQWEQFTGTFAYLLSIEGGILYGASLVLVKSLHELGHAYMASKYKLRVPTIGVAFMVLMPVLYTDTSASWRLRKNYQRLMIDFAGIFTELVIAIVATLLWVFMEDGFLRYATFTVATIGWVSSLVINLNPLMRFDGYYILSDTLKFPNMQERSFGMARWRLREILFDLGLEPPEQLGPKLRKIVIIHAWSTWIYRFFLFLGIAVLVYSFFIKAVGIILFMIEILWFILLPIWRELKHWWEIRMQILKHPRAYVTIGLFLALVIAAFIPWATSVKIPSVLSSEVETAVFPPENGVIVSVDVKEGQLVKKGDVLFKLRSDQLEREIKNNEIRRVLTKQRLNRISSDEKDRASRLVLENELRTSEEQAKGLKLQASELNIVAPHDGVVIDMDKELQKGLFVGPKNQLAYVQSPSNFEVRGYLEEASLNLVKVGAKATFIPEDPTLSKIDLKVKDIDFVAADVLNEAALAIQYGGTIVVEKTEEGTMKPEAGYYAVDLSIEQEVPWKTNKLIRGTTFIDGERESFFTRAKRQVLKIFIREFGV